MIAVIAFLILIVSALGLAFYREANTIYLVLKWSAIVSTIALLIIIGSSCFFFPAFFVVYNPAIQKCCFLTGSLLCEKRLALYDK